MNRLRAIRIAVSLGVALLFWLSVKLSAPYHTVVEVPLGYRNLPAALQLRAPLPPRLSVEVDGRGAQLLAHALGGDDSLLLDLSGAVSSGTLPRERLLLQVESHFPATVQVRSMSPDTLTLELVEKGLRQLRVRPEVSFVPAPGWWQRGPVTVSPDSVLVLAPRDQLATATAWPTKAIEIAADEARVQRNVPLVTGNQAIVDPATVRVSAQFDRYSEGRLSLPVDVANLPAGSQLRLSQPTVELRFLAAWAELPYLDASDFSLSVDLADLHPASPYLPVRITRAPAGIRGVQVHPPMLGVVLSRRL